MVDGFKNQQGQQGSDWINHDALPFQGRGHLPRGLEKA